MDKKVNDPTKDNSDRLNNESSVNWINIMKIFVPLLVTFTISMVGWQITIDYNNSQLLIAEEKNAADIEVAHINASLEYIKLQKEIPSTDSTLRNQTKVIISSVLPPQLGFDIAIEELSKNTQSFNRLMTKYKNESYQYLIPYLNYRPLKSIDLKLLSRRKVRNSNIDNYRININELEEVKGNILKALTSTSHIVNLFEYVIYTPLESNVRRNVLLNIIPYLKNNCTSLLFINTSSQEVARHTYIMKFLNSNISDEIKSDISFASIICANEKLFIDRVRGLEDKILNYLDEYFWENINISIGEIPLIGSLEQFVYTNKIYYHGLNDSIKVYGNSHVNSNHIEKIGKTLFDRLQKLNYLDIAPDQCINILESYALEYPRNNIYACDPFLNPEQILQLTESILESLNTSKRKEEFLRAYWRQGNMCLDDIYYTIGNRDSNYSKLFYEMFLYWCLENKDFAKGFPNFLTRDTEKYPDLEEELLILHKLEIENGASIETEFTRKHKDFFQKLYKKKKISKKKNSKI